MEKPDKQSKQVRIAFEYAREVEIESAVEGISIKAFLDRVWRERKNFEYSFFPNVFEVESNSVNRDETWLLLRLVASVLNRPSEDRDRKWLVGSLELLLDRVKLTSQGRDA